MTSQQSIVAVDVGNSTVKVAVTIEAGTTPQIETFPLDQVAWESEVCRWVQQIVAARHARWLVSTVNRSASEPLRKAVNQHCSTALNWQTLNYRDVPIELDVQHPERVGIDRVISCFAAAQRFPLPLIVVDAGSAVTVDHVTANREGHPVFGGGAIYPGIRLQLGALQTGTEGLKQTSQSSGGIDQRQSATLRPGKYTDQAIRLGILAAVVGGVERLRDDYFECEDSGHLIVTGGDGPVISEILRPKHESIEHLVCLGIVDLATNPCRNSASELE